MALVSGSVVAGSWSCSILATAAQGIEEHPAHELRPLRGQLAVVSLVHPVTNRFEHRGGYLAVVWR